MLSQAASVKVAPLPREAFSSSLGTASLIPDDSVPQNHVEAAKWYRLAGSRANTGAKRMERAGPCAGGGHG